MSSPIAPIGALRHSIHQSAGVASRALGSRQDPRAAQRDSAQASASASRPSSVMEPSVAAGGGILPRLPSLPGLPSPPGLPGLLPPPDVPGVPGVPVDGVDGGMPWVSRPGFSMPPGLPPLPGLPFPPLLPFPPGIDGPPDADRTRGRERVEVPEARIAEFEAELGSLTQAEKESLRAYLSQHPDLTVEELRRNQAYAALSAIVTLDDGAPGMPEGYSEVSAEQLAEMGIDASLFEDKDSGFKAKLYTRDADGPGGNAPEYILVFSGVNGEGSAKDILRDVANGLQVVPTEQFEQAIALATHLKERGALTDITGMSLGGGLAAAASVATGVEATTFNALGVHEAILARYGYSASDARLEGQITNIRIDGDWLTSVQEEGRVAGKWWEEWLTGPITAPAAALPDAVGRQITLPAIRDGQVIEVDSVSDAFYAHNYAAIRAALLTRVPSD